MKTPLQITCRNIARSEELEREIAARVDELEAFSGNIIGCRVMLERPHLHREKGNACHVRIDLTIPGEELVVSHQPSLHGTQRDFEEAEHTKETSVDVEHRSARVAIHEGFDKARRLLQDAVRRRRGDVKSHQERQFVEATIVRGQAVEAGEPLPSGATHEMVGRDERGEPMLKRKRFSTH